jgi:hypothetical protein
VGEEVKVKYEVQRGWRRREERTRAEEGRKRNGQKEMK